MKTYVAGRARTIQKSENYFERVMKRKSAINNKIDYRANIKNRLNQFQIILISSGDPLNYEWELRGDADFRCYLFPEGTQFSWRSSDIKEITTFTHPDDVITLNDFDDVAKVLYLDRYGFSSNELSNEAPLSIEEIQRIFGYNIPEHLFGFKQFEKTTYFSDPYDGNITMILGYKSGCFIFFDFCTS